MSVKSSVVQCSRNTVRFRLSINNIHGLFLTAVVEQFNNSIGKDNLFKKSLVLIKLWIYNESRRLTYLGFTLFLITFIFIYFLKLFFFVDLSELFGHDSLVVMTMMLFATRDLSKGMEIDNPVAALTCFLEIFSEMEWNSYHVTATSIESNQNYGIQTRVI